MSGDDKNRLAALPKITVVIPVKNESRHIENTILKILEQDYPPEKIEIIVACGESEDNSAEIVASIAGKDSRVKLFSNNVGLASGGRNIGVRNATGDIITFIDGHTYIDSNQLLMNTARLMDEKEVSVLSRPQFLDTPDNNFIQKAISLARKSALGHGLDSTIFTDKEMYVDPTSSGASYKREIFEEIGLYDERFDACEDVDFNFRLAKAGYKSFTSMKLAVFYYPRESIKGLFNQLKRYGVGRFRLARKHPETLSVSTLLPALFTGGMPLLGILSILSSPIFLLFLGILGIYILMILGGSIAISLRNGLRYLPFLPLIYPAIHIGLGSGFLQEFWRTFTGRGINFLNQT